MFTTSIMHLFRSLFLLQLTFRVFGAIDFTQPGPYSFKTITELTVVVTPQDAQALPTNEYKTTVRTPSSPPVGIILWSSGFMSQASDYKTILDQAASWGFASAAYDLPLSAANLSLKAELDYIFQAFISQIVNNNTIFNTTTPPLPLFSVGYSRGGKVAASVYANPNNTIQACYLIDPVDITPFSPDSPGNPSAVAALAIHPSTPLPLPLGITAAGITSTCNPSIGNYQTFWNVAGPSSWLGVLPGIAHTAFVDGSGNVRNALADAFCGGGNSRDTSEVAQLTYVPMLNWLTRSNLLLLENDNDSSSSSSSDGIAVKEQDEEFGRWVEEQIDQGSMVFEIKEEDPSPSPIAPLIPPTPPSEPVTPTSAALHHYNHHHSFAVLVLVVSLMYS